MVTGSGVVTVCGTGGIGSTGGIELTVMGTVAVVTGTVVVGTKPLITNVLEPGVITPLVFSCVATGSEVNEGPVNASPRTPIGISEVMNSKPVNGPDS
jgi:hypothetical protein